MDETHEEELSEKQWIILDSATKVFAEKGFEKSRTADIAKEAGIAEGTIFRYFKSKNDLLLGLVVPLITKFFRPLVIHSAERIMAKKKNLSVDETMQELYLNRMRLIDKNFPLIKTIMLEANHHPELLKVIREKIAPQVVEKIDSFMKGYVEDGTFRELELRKITRTLLSMLLGYILLSKSFPELFEEGFPEDEANFLADIVLNGFKQRKMEVEQK